MRLRTAIKIRRLMTRGVGGWRCHWRPATIRRARLICERKLWDQRVPVTVCSYTTTGAPRMPWTYSGVLKAMRKCEAEMAKIRPVDPFFDWPLGRDMVIEEVDAISKTTISRMGNVLFMHPAMAAELRRQRPESPLSRLLKSPL